MPVTPLQPGALVDGQPEQWYADAASNCTIKIVGLNFALRTPEFFLKVMERVSDHIADGTTLTLQCSRREPGRMLEWGLNIQYAAGGRLYVGIIQRKEGDDPEFHS